jgi:hypothetical protein
LRTTYGKERGIAVGSVYRDGKLPGVPVTEASNDGLESSRSCNEDGCAQDAQREDMAGDEVGDEIGTGKQGWV